MSSRPNRRPSLTTIGWSGWSPERSTRSTTQHAYDRYRQHNVQDFLRDGGGSWSHKERLKRNDALVVCRSRRRVLLRLGVFEFIRRRKRFRQKSGTQTETRFHR